MSHNRESSLDQRKVFEMFHHRDQRKFTLNVPPPSKRAGSTEILGGNWIPMYDDFHSTKPVYPTNILCFDLSLLTKHLLLFVYRYLDEAYLALRLFADPNVFVTYTMT